VALIAPSDGENRTIQAERNGKRRVILAALDSEEAIARRTRKAVAVEHVQAFVWRRKQSMILTGHDFHHGRWFGDRTGLAEALHKRGNQIIISGRRKSHLEATTKANPGMVSMSWIFKTRRASPRWQRSSLPSIRKSA
jgi:hypothetical protein